MLIVFSACDKKTPRLFLFQDDDTKFQISYPENWIKKNNEEGARVVISSRDGKAEVRVGYYQNNSKLSAAEFLSGIEKSMKVTNLLPADKQKASSLDILKYNAEDAALGYYQLTMEKTPVLFEIFIYQRGKRFYMVTKGVEQPQAQEHGLMLNSIVSSFKVLD